jgi:hypothetical protein
MCLSILLCGPLWPKKTYLPNADGRYNTSGSNNEQLKQSFSKQRATEIIKVETTNREPQSTPLCGSLFSSVALCGQKKLALPNVVEDIIPPEE